MRRLVREDVRDQRRAQRVRDDVLTPPGYISRRKGSSQTKGEDETNDATLLLELWMPPTPQPVRLVALVRDGLDHALAVVRHEVGDVDEDVVGQLSDQP